jgi:hypothetical protein
MGYKYIRSADMSGEASTEGSICIGGSYVYCLETQTCYSRLELINL